MRWLGVVCLLSQFTDMKTLNRCVIPIVTCLFLTSATLVHGEMPLPSGRLSSFLKKRRQKVSFTDEKHKRAQEAVLSYRTLVVRGEVSLLEVQLHTGRKHQIRVQLAAEGCPIVGDVKYGAPERRKDGTICLLAKSLTFMHPTRPETIHIEVPPPDWAI